MNKSTGWVATKEQMDQAQRQQEALRARTRQSRAQTWEGDQPDGPVWVRRHDLEDVLGSEQSDGHVLLGLVGDQLSVVALEVGPGALNRLEQWLWR